MKKKIIYVTICSLVILELSNQSTLCAAQPAGKIIEVGLVYKGIEPGIGDPSVGFSPIRANVVVTGLTVPIPVGTVVDKLLSLDPTGVVNKVMVLNGETVFLLKLIGLFNELKLFPPDVAMDEKISFALSNLGPLLARLSKTQLIDSKGQPILDSDGKPQYVQGFSTFLEKLPAPLRELFNMIQLPGLVTAYDVQVKEDCAGKPASEMRLVVSDIRQAEGFDARLTAMNGLFPLLENADSAGKLTRTDLDLLEYVFLHTSYDMGIVPATQPKDEAAAEIAFRAGGLAPFINDILGVLESVTFNPKVQPRAAEVITSLDALLKKIADPEDKEDDQGPYTEWVAKASIPTFSKPIVGGERGSTRIAVAVPVLLDILFNRIKYDTLDYKFVGFDLDAVYDDSNMSKEQAVFYALAVALRALQEKNNPDFNLMEFVQTALTNMYMRAPQYFEPLMKIIQPIMAKVQQLQNDLQGLAGNAMGQAEQMQQQYVAKVNAIAPLDDIKFPVEGEEAVVATGETGGEVAEEVGVVADVPAAEEVAGAEVPAGAEVG